MFGREPNGSVRNWQVSSWNADQRTLDLHLHFAWPWEHGLNMCRTKVADLKRERNKLMVITRHLNKLLSVIRQEKEENPQQNRDYSNNKIIKLGLMRFKFAFKETVNRSNTVDWVIRPMTNFPGLKTPSSTAGRLWVWFYRLLSLHDGSHDLAFLGVCIRVLQRNRADKRYMHTEINILHTT